MVKKFEVEVVGETSYAEWNRLVAEAPGGSVYSMPEYLDALCRAAGGELRVVGVRQGGELVGGAALYVRSAVYGDYVTPRLLLYYNGVLTRRYPGSYPSKETAFETEALGALGDHLATQGLASLNLRCRAPIRDVRPLLERGWSAAPSYSYVVSLTDMASSWARVEQNLRRLVKRCTDQGMELSSDDDFGAFVQLHHQSLTRKGTGEYLPDDAFRRFLETLARQDLCRLFHVRGADGAIIAAQLVLLGPHPVAHTVAAATAPELMKSGVSAFLRWRTCEALAALGYAGIDLTDAALNSVTHFKSQLGGDLELNLVLDSPRTFAFRAGTAATRGARRARGALGSLARRLTGRRR